MKLRDIQIGEQYAVKLDGVQVQHVVRYDIARVNGELDSDPHDPFVQLGVPNYAKLARGAMDYGYTLETGERLSGSLNGRWGITHDYWTVRYFACGTVLAKGVPYGKTKLGVHVQTPLLDWWPVDRWHLRTPVGEILSGAARDGHAEAVAEVYASPSEAIFCVNATSAVVCRWVDLPQYRIDKKVWLESLSTDYTINRILEEGETQ